jgi:hypothetical protein
VINVQHAVEKWQRNMMGATETIKAGVQGVTESPTLKAAAQADRYVAGVQRAVADGRWQAGLQSVTLQQWQQAVLGKGLQRLQAGVAAAKPKVQAFLSQFLPYVDQAAQQVRAMPKGGVENGIARASAMIRALSEFKFRKSI